MGDFASLNLEKKKRNQMAPKGEGSIIYQNEFQRPLTQSTRRKTRNDSGLFGFIKYMVVRLIFIVHGCLAYYRVTESYGKIFFWHQTNPYIRYMSGIGVAGIILGIFEIFYTIAIHNKKDLKYFCAPIFCYLVSIIPSLVLLMAHQWFADTGLANQSSECNPDNVKDLIFLYPSSSSFNQSTITVEPILMANQNLTNESVANWGGNTMLYNDEDVDWIMTFHQLLLFIIVLGRWVLPRGDISRDELSQLLLIFIGTGADIIEFVSETVGDDLIEVCNAKLHLIMWACWSWSLLQFPFVLTAFGQKNGGNSRYANERSKFSNPEVWGIFLVLFLQEIPFLAARLYFMYGIKVKTGQTMIFFTCKNGLVILLQLYRLQYLACKRRY